MIRKQYTKEFKLEAVKLAEKTGVSRIGVSRNRFIPTEYGVPRVHLNEPWTRVQGG